MNWANLAGLEGLPALLGPPQTYRSVPGIGLCVDRASGQAAFVWALLLGSPPPLAFQPCGKEVPQHCESVVTELGLQCPVTLKANNKGEIGGGGALTSRMGLATLQKTNISVFNAMMSASLFALTGFPRTDEGRFKGRSPH